MKRVVSIALVLAMLGWTVPARAAIGTIDEVPAATLLLPYFEVDLDNPGGLTTLLSINNASATAVLAHVTIWSDLSVEVLNFNVYLTGFDVQTINLRDIIVNGVLPRTASDGQDPQDTISPQGDFSQDINFASCNGQLPPKTLAQVLAETGADYVGHMQAALTGQSSPILSNQCAGQVRNDRIARGYVTVDTVTNCTLSVHSGPGYFAGDVSYQNVLWGDYFYVNPGENFAQGETLVHIESCQPGNGYIGYVEGPLPTTCPFAPGAYTFYGRYVGWNGGDQREPLATSFAARFLNGGGFTGGTEFAVWRDSKVVQEAFTCPATPGVQPPWYPLAQEGIVIFDEQESAEALAPALSPFPAEANRTQVGGADLPVPFQFGWIYLNLNQSNATAGANPPVDASASQAWVTVLHSADGRFSVGYSATQLDNATAASHLVPGP